MWVIMALLGNGPAPAPVNMGPVLVRTIETNQDVTIEVRRGVQFRGADDLAHEIALKEVQEWLRAHPEKNVERVDGLDEEKWIGIIVTFDQKKH